MPESVAFVPVPFENPLEVLYSKPRTVAFAPLMFVMLPPRVAPVVLMEVTVALVVRVGAEAVIGAEPDNELVIILKFPEELAEIL